MRHDQSILTGNAGKKMGLFLKDGRQTDPERAVAIFPCWELNQNFCGGSGEIRMRYRVAKHKKGFVCVIYYQDGTRRRVTLKASDKFAATAEAARVVGVLKSVEPRRSITVGEILDAYFEQSEAIWKENDRLHWKGISQRPAALSPGAISTELLKELAGLSPCRVGTIRKRHSVLRAALNWASAQGIIDKAPRVWRPLRRRKTGD